MFTKSYQRLDSNLGSVVSEVTTLSIVSQQLSLMTFSVSGIIPHVVAASMTVPIKCA